MISPSFIPTQMLAQRGLRDAQAIIAQAAERLATGKRLNRAADDPAGLLAADSMTRIITAAEARLKGLDQEEARLGATEGALSVVGDLLDELNGLVVQAANTGGMSREEVEALQVQADSVLGALDMLANTATFKGEKLFASLFTTSLGRVVARSTDDDGNETAVGAMLGAMRSGGVLNLVDGDLEAAQKSVEGAIDTISTRRGAIGNRVRHGINSERAALFAELENHRAARSQIVDADVAAEVSNLVRGQILEQASISALLLARQSPQAALRLLNAAAA
jgi:flagellin